MSEPIQSIDILNANLKDEATRLTASIVGKMLDPMATTIRNLRAGGFSTELARADDSMGALRTELTNALWPIYAQKILAEMMAAAGERAQLPGAGDHPELFDPPELTPDNDEDPTPAPKRAKA